jgi:hypothetical protein
MYWLKQKSTNLSSYWIAGCTCDFTLNSFPFNSTEVAWNCKYGEFFNTSWWYAIGSWEFCQTGAAHIGHILLPSGEASRWARKYIGQEVLTLFINASRVLSSPSSQTCAGRITYAISCINTLWLVIVQRNYAIIPSSAIRILTWCLPGYGCALW